MRRIPKYNPEGHETGVTFKRINRAAVPPLRSELAVTPFQEKPHISTWFLTFNTNKGLKLNNTNFNEDQFDIMEYVVECLFNDDRQLLQFMNIRQNLPNHPELQGHSITPEMLKNRELFPDIPGKPGSNRKVTWVREIGKKRNRMHLHVKFHIIHYTWLDINQAKLREMAAHCIKKLRLETSDPTLPSSIYVSCRYVANSKFIVGNYMSKEGLGLTDLEESLDRLTLEDAQSLEKQGKKPEIKWKNF